MSHLLSVKKIEFVNAHNLPHIQNVARGDSEVLLQAQEQAGGHRLSVVTTGSHKCLLFGRYHKQRIPHKSGPQGRGVQDTSKVEVLEDLEIPAAIV